MPKAGRPVIAGGAEITDYSRHGPVLALGVPWDGKIYAQ
jgi:hypothetical protein